jgi:hypothetical protein
MDFSRDRPNYDWSWQKEVIILKLTSLAIGLLTIVSITPESEVMVKIVAIDRTMRDRRLKQSEGSAEFNIGDRNRNSSDDIGGCQ